MQWSDLHCWMQLYSVPWCQSSTAHSTHNLPLEIHQNFMMNSTYLITFNSNKNDDKVLSFSTWDSCYDKQTTEWSVMSMLLQAGLVACLPYLCQRHSWVEPVEDAKWQCHTLNNHPGQKPIEIQLQSHKHLIKAQNKIFF